MNVPTSKELESQFMKQQLKTIETFEDLLNATLEGLILYNYKKECIKVNTIAHELLGYTPDEMIGKSAFDFISEESMELVKIAPENLEVANAYLSTGSALTAASSLGVTPDKVYEVLEKSDVKDYINSVY